MIEEPNKAFMRNSEVHNLIATEPQIWRRLAEERRFAAYALWHIPEAQVREMAHSADFQSSTPEWPLELSFYREAGQALELILKACLAKEVQAGTRSKMPLLHDIAELWGSAGMPRLAGEDMKRLRLFTRVGVCFGRYPVPSTYERGDRESALLRTPLEDVSSLD